MPWSFLGLTEFMGNLPPGGEPLLPELQVGMACEWPLLSPQTSGFTSPLKTTTLSNVNLTLELFGPCPHLSTVHLSPRPGSSGLLQSRAVSQGRPRGHTFLIQHFKGKCLQRYFSRRLTAHREYSTNGNSCFFLQLEPTYYLRMSKSAFHGAKNSILCVDEISLLESW